MGCVTYSSVTLLRRSSARFEVTGSSSEESESYSSEDEYGYASGGHSSVKEVLGEVDEEEEEGREREMAESSAVTPGVSGPVDGAESPLTTLLSPSASSARSLVYGDPGGSAWSGRVWSLWTVWSTGVGVAMLGR